VSEEIHDHTPMLAYAAARRKAMFLHALWKPMLAGALGARLIIAAVAVAQPRFVFRDIEIPRVTMRDVTVPNIVAKDIEVPHIILKDVEIPRVVSPEPVTPEERSFVATPGWKGAVVRGRIERAEGNGFVMLTDTGEQSFSPAKIGAGAKIEFDPSLKDDVSAALGALAFCRQTPIGVFQCTALGHDGREAVIPEIPIGSPL
jgi:hypothetical protein